MKSIPLIARHRSIAALAAILAVAGSLRAQTANPPAAPANPNPAAANSSTEPAYVLDQYVVTATPGGKVTELTAAMDVSVVNHTDIVTTTAAGPAGLLDAVPGFYGQSSGGEVNQNLSVDGLNPHFFTFISLQEDGLPVQYNGFFPEFQIRPDSTYGSVDAVRNGPSTVYAPAAAAATVNFISRMPSVDEGDTTFSVTSEGNKRVDFFYGGPVAGANGWSAGVGGYYESGQGERPVGYTITEGGQVRAYLKKEFTGGALTITYKNINAHVPFYVDVPFYEDSTGHLHEVAGFDAKYDTLYSPETATGTLHPPIGQGDAQPLNLSNGNSDLNNTITVKLEKDLGDGWSFFNNARVGHFTYVDDDDRSNGNSSVATAASFLTSNLGALQANNAAVTKDELVQVATGNVISNPGAMNENGLLIDSSNFVYQETHDTIIDDLRTTWATDSNTLDVGMMYLYDGMTLYSTGNEELTDVTNHAQLYDIAGLNKGGQVVNHLTDNGVLQYDSSSTAYFGAGTQNTSSMNYYLNDQFEITKQLRLDGGFRYEQTNYSTNAEEVSFGEPLPMAAANPSIVADQVDGSYGNGNYGYASNGGNDMAWSFGANYLLTDHFSLFARTTKSFDEGVQDFNLYNIGGGPASATLGDPSRSGYNTLRFDQAGARFENRSFAVSATAFFATYDNVGESVTANSGPPTNVYVSIQSKGVDFETVWKPVHEFSFNLSGVAQHAELVDLPAGTIATGGSAGIANGNQPDRMPDVQFRAQPKVYLDRPDATYFAHATASLTATYYGQRYGDLANTQIFDAYVNWGAEITVDITKDLTLTIVGDNLANALGFTEGNPRGGDNLSTTAGYVLARPIWGRNGTASLTYRF